MLMTSTQTDSIYSTSSVTTKDRIKEQRQETMDKVNTVTGYYREHPENFVEDYLNIILKPFQSILICFMNICNQFMFLACRGLGKTFLVAIFCVVRCILYPGTTICIASGNRKQANLVLDKIINLIMPGAPNLRAEIESWSITGEKGEITFRNTSKILVVTSRDSARGARANILITDEFRMVSKDVIQTVLKKFLSNPRQPGFFTLKKYQYQRPDGSWHVKPEYQERNKEIYMSSAWFCSHWSYAKAKGYAATMLDDSKKCFICGFPYQLAIREGLLMREQVEDDMAESDYNEVSWSMEMDCLFYGDFEGSFYEYPVINQTRTIKYPWLPPDYSRLAGDKKLIIPPKQHDEKRILSIDIALMATTTKHKNDASAIFINSCVPQKQKGGRFVHNIIYSDTLEGELTRVQALIVRKLYEQFDCDYIVIDANGVGSGVYDALVEEIKDTETGVVYPPLSCCNNPDMASRCKDKSAPKVIWAIKAGAKFNSDCALALREGFKSGRIKLLINEFDAETCLNDIKGYSNLSPIERTKIIKQYINTTLLVNELVKLNIEENNKLIKVKEMSGMRKDRFSSLSYNYYVARQIEDSIRQKGNTIYSAKDFFVFRAPDMYKYR